MIQLPSGRDTHHRVSAALFVSIEGIDRISGRSGRCKVDAYPLEHHSIDFKQLIDRLLSGAMNDIRTCFFSMAADLIAQFPASPGFNMTDGTGLFDPGADKSVEAPLAKEMAGDSDIVMQVVNSLGLQPSINTHWYFLRFWSCFLAVFLAWIFALSNHGTGDVDDYDYDGKDEGIVRS